MTVHVVGTGLAGLAAAVRLVQRGKDVVMWEAAAQAGGRVRSLDCPVLGRTIDNGTHLVLSGNRSIAEYLSAIGASSRMETADAAFPFLDVATNTAWTVRPSLLPLPLWLFSASRRVPGARFGEYMRVRAFARAKPGDTVADCIGSSGMLYDRFWKPLTLAVMNASPEEAAALPMAVALRESLLRGSRACRPMMAKKSLHHALIAPALETVAKAGGVFQLNQRLTRMVVLNNRVESLIFGDEGVALGPDDAVVLALPPWGLAKVWPGASLPDQTRGILNVHYRVDDLAPAMPRLIGVANGAIHWVAVRNDVVSVTVSAVDDLLETKSEALAARLWPEVSLVLGCGDKSLPPYRVIKERRATPLQSPDMQPRRPHHRTALANAVLAGDWTATELPCSMESAVRSGFSAVDVLANMDF